jgi:glycosyltransferase involved in cell wall biosynthesis
MGRRGRELVLRDYSWERVTSQLVEVYEEGIERAAAQARH